MVFQPTTTKTALASGTTIIRVIMKKRQLAAADFRGAAGTDPERGRRGKPRLSA
jgi:hypothetical protein